MSQQPQHGPGGPAWPLPEHSTAPALDLDYANQRLRSEQNRVDQTNHSNTNAFGTSVHDDGLPNSKNGTHGRHSRGSMFTKLARRRKLMAILVALSAMLLAILVFCVAVFTIRAQSRCPSTPTNPNPSGVVSLSYGRYQGTTLANGVDQFLGVRYAATPTRFSAPQYPQNFSGVQQAFQLQPGCQGAGTPNGSNAEDCLFADIYRPTNASSSSKLPVYVFIQGGGLADSTGHFNGSGLVIASNMSLITVSFTYRVGLFGFLASAEVQEHGSLNSGYLDQHQLLQWVQKEIAQFGGDPGHVALGGQSAGAGSVVSHLTAYGGVDQHLFQGAIMQSQSMPPIRNVSQQQYQYDQLVNSTSCTSSSNTLDCLRGVPYDELLAHGGATPYPGNPGPPVYAYNPVVDDDFITDLPISMFERGEFVHVPTVFGDDTNEGTIFTPRYLATQDQSIVFMNNNFPELNSDQLNEIASIYNFNETNSPHYWLQASWAYGETRYTCPGIHMSNLITNISNTNVWNWHYDIATPAQNSSLNFVSHGSEMPAIWGPQYQGPSGPAEMLATNATHTVAAMQGYWISFIKTFDPNKLKADLAPTWDAWNGSNRVLFELNRTSMETIDEGQMRRCGYLSQLMKDLQQ